MPAVTWTLLPALQTVIAGQDATLTNAWVGGVGTSQDFTFSDGGLGGTFTPSSQTGVMSPSSFLYRNPVVGTYFVTVTPGTGPCSTEAPKVVQVNVTAGSTTNVPYFDMAQNISCIRSGHGGVSY
jgi:hypothetical protein